MQPRISRSSSVRKQDIHFSNLETRRTSILHPSRGVMTLRPALEKFRFGGIR